MLLDQSIEMQNDQNPYFEDVIAKASSSRLKMAARALHSALSVPVFTATQAGMLQKLQSQKSTNI